LIQNYGPDFMLPIFHDQVDCICEKYLMFCIGQHWHTN